MRYRELMGCCIIENGGVADCWMLNVEIGLVDE